MMTTQINEAKKYEVSSSYGMSIFAKKKTEVLITPDRLSVKTDKEIKESGIDQIFYVSKALFIAPINMILMLLVAGLPAFACQFYKTPLWAFIAICVVVVVLVVLGINHRVQVVLKDGTVVNIDSMSSNNATEIMNDLMAREACDASKKSKVYILEVITALCIALFIGINAYDCFVPDKYVEKVKTSVNTDYAGVTYGDAFAKYFTDGKWDSFDSKSGGKVVEFTGKCDINGAQSKVLIQYVIDGDYFNFVYYEVNGTGSTTAEYNSLMTTVFAK